LLITIAAGYFGGPVGAAVASAYTTAHAAAVNGANLKDSYIAGARAGVMSGVSAGIFKGAHILGEAGGNTVARLLLHGVAGGIMSELNGGKFGHGFASAFVTQLLEGAISENVDALNEGFSWERVAVAGMVGGAVSAATGGKFVNGAVSGAMSRGLNAEIKHSKAANSKSKKNSSKPTQSNKTIYVGGFFDRTNKGLVYQKEKQNNGKSLYFDWTQTEEITAAIVAESGNVTVVAHSYGADTALEIIADGNQVFHLKTIDPVGWTRPSMELVASNTNLWENYDAIGGITDFNSFFANAAAFIGNSYDTLPDGHADSHHRVDTDHAKICFKHC
jgi:hypothetical protein